MRPRTRLVIAAVAATLAVAACGGSTQADSSAAPGDVVVTDSGYAPGALEVAVDDVVTWRFTGRARHDVVFTDGESSPLHRSGTWNRAFPTAGTYTYVCSLHPNMTGTVVVHEADSHG